MASKEQVEKYASDFLAFADDLVIPAGHGPARFGDVMADFQRQRFTDLAPALHAVAKGQRPPIGRYWWEATKGASEDSDLAVALLWLLTFSFRPRPLDCQVAAGDKDQANELRKAAKDILRLNPWLSAAIEIQAFRITNARSESVCEIIAADVIGSHGARPDVLIANELSCVTKQEFVENLFDNLTKIPFGLGIVATNSGFTGSWQYEWRENARTSDRWRFSKVDYPAPWLDEDEVEEARKRNSASRFNRLWRGIWVSGAGDALDPEDIQAAIVLDDEGYYALPGHSYVGGLDLGVRCDHSGLVILGCDHTTGRIKLASCESWKPTPGSPVDLELVRQGVLVARSRFGMKTCLYDPHQCEYLAQVLRDDGLLMEPMLFVGANLNLMASTLLETFRSRRLDLYQDDDLINDLRKLAITEKSYGYKLEAVRDQTGHADRAIALAIVLPFATEVAALPPAEHFDDGLGTNIFGPMGYQG